MNRVVGIETEYGACPGRESIIYTDFCEVSLDSVLDNAVHFCSFSKKHIFSTSVGETSGFTTWGGRFYTDRDHIEGCTAECLDVSDLLKQHYLGDYVLNTILSESLGLEGYQGIRNNVDVRNKTSFGQHENYCEIDKFGQVCDLLMTDSSRLIPFLIVRSLIAGAGLVVPFGKDAGFYMTQRAGFTNKDSRDWFRGISIEHPQVKRIHITKGDTNVLPYAVALKTAFTSLILDMYTHGKLPKVHIQDEEEEFFALSKSCNPKHCIKVGEKQNRYVPAIDLLAHYVEQAEEYFERLPAARKDPDHAWAIKEMNFCVDALRNDHSKLVGKIDWVTKRKLIKMYKKEHNLDWDNDALVALDLECHHTNDSNLIFNSLGSDPWTEIRKLSTGHNPLPTGSIPEGANLLLTPPQNTRAKARGRMLRTVIANTINSPNNVGINFNWDYINKDFHKNPHKKTISLMNPYRSRLRPSKTPTPPQAELTKSL